MDCWAEISELCECFLQVDRGTLFEVVKNCLLYYKLSARWVPKELTTEHLTKHFMLSLDLLTCYTNEFSTFYISTKFLHNFLTTTAKFFHIFQNFSKNFRKRTNFCTPMFLDSFSKISSQLIIIWCYPIICQPALLSG